MQYACVFVHLLWRETSGSSINQLMIFFIFIFFSRWPFRHGDGDDAVEGKTLPIDSHIIITSHNKSKTPEDFKEHLMNWLSVSADNIVILILLLALAVKFIFFEDRGEIAQQLRLKEAEEPSQSQSPHEESAVESMHVTTLDASIRQRFGVTLPALHQSVFPLSGMGDNWVEVGNESHIEVQDKEVQTDGRALSTDETVGESSLEAKTPRSVEECLSIYRSEVSWRTTNKRWNELFVIPGCTSAG